MRWIVIVVMLAASSAWAQMFDLCGGAFWEESSLPSVITLPTPYWYYKFESNLADSSGLGHDATYVLAAPTYSDRKTGNKYAQIGASGRYVCGYPVNNFTNFTMGFWLYSPYVYGYRVFMNLVVATNNTARAFSAESANNNYITYWRIYQANGSTLAFDCPWTPSSSYNGWTYMTVVVSNSAGMYVYANDQLVSQDLTRSGTSIFSTETTATGCWIVYGYYGMPMDSMQFFNVSFTREQISQLYSNALVD